VRCQLVCANTADGKDVWVLDMIGQLGVFPHNLATCSPLLLGDLVFVVTGNGVDRGHINVPAPAAPSFVAVNKKDGSVAWQNNAPSANLLNMPKGANKNAFIKGLVDQGKLLMHGQWSNPVYASANGQPQIIFPGGDGWLRSFEPTTGKLVWEFDCNPKDAFYVLGSKATRNDFVATPVVHDNKVYIGVGQDPEHEEGVGHFWCIDVTKKGDVSTVLFDKIKLGDHTWADRPKGEKDRDNSALVWHYGGVGDAKTRIPGRREKYVFGRTLSTACVHDGLVYIAELGGYLHCLDAKTGERLWFHNLKAPVWSSPYYCDGKVYMGTDDDVVYVFEAGR
jgi:outer membrane protein assembly factor BamB